MKRLMSFLCFACVFASTTCCQSNSPVIHFNKISEFELSGFFSTYSSLFDRNGHPYLYSASLGLGLIVYDISDVSTPTPVDTLEPNQFNGLNVNNVYQDGNYLYLALGGFQGIPQKAGMAILDISNPSNISIIATWDSIAYKQGCATVRTDERYAYLGAMEDGIIILDISDKNNPKFVSQFQPDPSFPGVANYPPNARGMEIRDHILYLAYDAGGLRLIDISDKQHPSQIAQYVNTSLISKALPAYNNLRIVGDYAFIAVDFCGLEVVDISNPSNLRSVDWYNPWNCNGFSWFGSPGHANELITANQDSILFLSGADSEVLALDISNPGEVKKNRRVCFCQG